MFRNTGLLIVLTALAAVVLLRVTEPPSQPVQPARANEEGYLILAISWTPSWCAVEGAARGAERCAPGADAGWLVHGLWPQYAQGGWPEFCDSPHDGPSRAQTAAMVDIMGSGGLAFHQWRKHGTCTGLSPEVYFAATRAAFEHLTMPARVTASAEDLRKSPDALLEAFRAANPGIGADMAILTCRDGMAQEIRLCLDNELAPRRCDDQLLSRTCRARSVRLPALP